MPMHADLLPGLSEQYMMHTVLCLCFEKALKHLQLLPQNKTSVQCQLQANIAQWIAVARPSPTAIDNAHVT